MLNPNGFLMKAIVKKQREGYVLEQKKLDDTYVLADGITEIVLEDYSLYVPEGDLQSCPVIVNVHGGGMMMGNRQFNRYHNAHMAKQGYVVIAAEYPLAPEHTLPQMLTGLMESICKGIEALKEHKVTADGIFLTGDSAGAFLCMALAAVQYASFADLTSVIPPIKGLSLFCGMHYSMKNDINCKILGPLTWGKSAKKWGDWVKPEYMISRIYEKKRLPMLLFTSDGDMLKSYTVDFGTYLEQMCRKEEFEMHVFHEERLCHAFPVFMPDDDYSMQTVELTDCFFKRTGRG